MNSMKIGTYQMDTSFGLYLPEYTIPAPTPQTNFVQIIGRDGSVDLSEAIGLHYNSRVWDLDFKCFNPTVNWHTLTSQVMNAIHGKRLNFEFDDDPDYFWTGRVSVSSYVSNHGTGNLKINITSDPFKYKKLSTIVTKNASAGTAYTGSLVTFNTANAKINDLSVSMQPIQSGSGDPSPENIRPISGRTGLSVYRTGKNLYDMSRQIASGNNANYGTTLAENTDYTFSVSSSVSGLYIAYSDAETMPPVDVNANWTNMSLRYNTSSVTANSGSHKWYRLQAYNSSGLTDMTYQLELGSTATAYEPYNGTTYSVDWTTQAGTVYGVTVDVVTGQLTVDTVCATKALSAFSLVETKTNTKHYRYMGNFFGSSLPLDSGSGNLCNIAPNAYNSRDATHFYPVTGTGRIELWVPVDLSTDTEVQIAVPIATPLTYQLSAHEIEALVGTNNVWSDGGNVTVAVVTPETLTNNGRAVVPTLTASADMVLKWGNYSASVQQGTSTVPQLILENGANLIYIIGTGTLSFTWQEASL